MRYARTLSLAGAALMLSGCSALGSQDAGGAAARSKLGDIGQDELIAQVQAFQSEIGLPVNQPAPGVARSTLERMLQDQLIQAKAAQLGITVTPAQVDDGVAQLTSQQGGESGLAEAAHASGLAVSAVPDLVRSNLLVAAIADKLAGGADNTTAVLEVQKSVVQLAAAANVRVAPRYGVWVNDTLSIDPVSTVTQASAEPSPTIATPNPQPTETPVPEASASQPGPTEPAANPSPSPSE